MISEVGKPKIASLAVTTSDVGVISGLGAVFETE